MRAHTPRWAAALFCLVPFEPDAERYRAIQPASSFPFSRPRLLQGPCTRTNAFSSPARSDPGQCVISGALSPAEHGGHLRHMPHLWQETNRDHRVVAGPEAARPAPDAVVIVSNGHLQNCLLPCLPAFAVHRRPRAAGTFAGRGFSWSVESEYRIRRCPCGYVAMGPTLEVSSRLAGHGISWTPSAQMRVKSRSADHCHKCGIHSADNCGLRRTRVGEMLFTDRGQTPDSGVRYVRPRRAPTRGLGWSSAAAMSASPS